MKRKLAMLLLVAGVFVNVSVKNYGFFFKKKQDPIILGFLPNESGSEFEGFREGLEAELEKALGEDVLIKTTDSYDALIDAALAGEVDIAFSGGSQYILAKDAPEGGDNIQVLFTYGIDGKKEKAGYLGWIATKKNSDLHKEIIQKGIEGDTTPEGTNEKARIGLLRGKRFGFVSPSSSSGFKVPRAILNTVYGPNGTGEVAHKDDFANPKKVDFMDITFSATGDHQGSINAVYNQSVEAGAFCEGYFLNGVDADSIDDFYVLATRIVPNAPVWVNVEALGEDKIEKIKNHFDGLGPNTATETGKKLWADRGTLLKKKDKFILVDDSFFEILRQM